MKQILLLITIFLSLAFSGRCNNVYSRNDFPEGFVFGSAFSAFQWEGAVDEDGRKPSIWDTYVHSHAGPTGDVACDGYHKYKEDVRLMYDMGLSAFRLSISWPRLIPSGRGHVNPKGLRFYKNLINELTRHGIEPHVTLYHNDLPQALEDEYGGWIDRRIIDDFTAFADVCFKEFGNSVKFWTTINEPNMLAWGGYDLGFMLPKHCSPPFVLANCSKGNSSTEPYIALHNMLIAHASTARLYKQKYKTHHFDEKASAIAADSWRTKLEENFDVIRCPQEFRRDLGVQYLKDDAMIWWKGVVESTQGRYELSWADFKDEFTREYFPPEAMDRMMIAFDNLHQDNRTVREYKEEFNRLRRFTTRHLNEEDLIRKFKNGLRIELKNRCTITNYVSMVDLVETAAVQEIGLQEELMLSRNAQAKSEKGAESHKRNWDTTNLAPAMAPKGAVCYICRQSGHVKRDCTVDFVPREFQPLSSTCNFCGQIGHFARQCMVPLQEQQPRGQNREQLQLPPPPAGQVARPRVFMIGDHGGGGPIAVM